MDFMQVWGSVERIGVDLLPSLWCALELESQGPCQHLPLRSTLTDVPCRKKSPCLGRAPCWQLPEYWLVARVRWLGKPHVAEPLGEKCQQESGGHKVS